jgi:hypothetical protein
MKPQQVQLNLVFKHLVSLCLAHEMRVLAFTFLVCQAAAFAPIPFLSRTMNAAPFSPLAVRDGEPESSTFRLCVLSNRPKVPALIAGLSSGIISLVSSVLAADGIEMAELPAPYVPVLFGLGLLVGVGVLTGSLGDVMDEEASLGLQSGARAKKDIERSRSSYFKKK